MSWRHVTWIGILLLLATLASSVVASRNAAKREHHSYAILCSLGATGDDWVSVFEIVTGRPPIVQLDLPANVPIDTAFKLMPDLHHLVAITLRYPSLSDAQLAVVRDLNLESLRFGGDFPTDADVSRLSRFRGVRFVYVPATNLSTDAKTQLETLLPSSKVDFY